jgi:hypothetical protein
MFEYRTASFILQAKKNGEPLSQVDDALSKLQTDGWDFVQLSSSATVGAIVVVLVVRREKTT